MKYVYHSSKIQNLTLLLPRHSTHKKSWVYATKDIALSALFLGNHSDFICQTGIQEGRPFIYERFEGALEYAFKNKKGSIYKLSGKNFESGKTSWSGDLVSEKEESVIEEIKVNNALAYLNALEKEDKLSIYKFPNQPEGTVSDKSDLVERGINWTFDFGESTLDQVERYHPDILDKVIQDLKDKAYVFTGEKWSKYNKK